MEDLKRLTINLPLFSFDHGSFKSPSSASRSPRSFEDGIVGLGIVAAMDQFNDNNKSRQLSGKSEKTSAKLVVSPKSSQVLRETITGGSDSKYRSMSNLERNGSSIELSEHYTCVIFHAGDQSAKKREYFDDGGHSSTIAISSGRALSVSSPSVFQVAEFLNSCFLCGKRLDGLDIFMYRGEKAFCSAECRNKQMEMDDQKENWGAAAMKSLDYSVSPCSGQLQFFAQVVAV